MKIINDIGALRELRRHWQQAGETTVALVPTMGNLHDGHLALVRRGRQLADRVLVSIFVNPTQFDRADDFAAYPRTLAADQEKLAAAGADALFAPAAAAIYPDGGLATRVEVPGISEILEGASRPGHFTGVATIVCKLFNLTQPQWAIFGEKDFQQLLLIRRMVADLNLPLAIDALPTVREADGLAMSSRNSRLSPAERATAPALYRILQETAAGLLPLNEQPTPATESVSDRAKAMTERFQQGQQAADFSARQQEAIAKLAAAGFRPDYVEIRRQADLTPPTINDTKLVILAAAWLGPVRLIDNLPLEGTQAA